MPALYVTTPGKLQKLLRSIQGVGVPDEVSPKVLAQWGYDSSNDPSMVPLLKSLGFIDHNGVPQQRWQEYRDKSLARAVLGQAICESYTKLFRVFPDAYRKDDEAIRNFFRGESKAKDRTVGLMVRTFRALVAMADFAQTSGGEQVVPPPAMTPSTPSNGPRSPRVEAQQPRSADGLVVNLNIQLQLPETDRIEVFENLFKAMRKHLLQQGE